MGKIIYMESTINMMGKNNGKKTKKLIDSGEIVNTEDVNYLVKDDTKKNEIRKTLDGKPLVELDEPMALIVNTKVPHKWILQDTETGEIYRGTTEHTIGKQWEKIIEITEDGQDK